MTTKNSKIAENVAWRSIRAEEVEDRRRSKAKPWGFIIMIDNFMSGWGKAPGRSYYAVAVDSQEEADMVTDNADKRSEMKSIRLRRKLPKLAPDDHLAVVDKYSASDWFEPTI